MKCREHDKLSLQASPHSSHRRVPMNNFHGEMVEPHALLREARVRP